MSNILNMLEQYALVKAIESIARTPNRSFSVREFAKEAKLSSAMASIALNYMKKMELVTLKEIGRTYQYRANLESPLMRQWKIIFSCQQLQEAGLVKEANSKIRDIQSILLYGSKARGTDDEKSDFDLLIIAHHPPKERGLDALRRLGDETNLLIYSPQEWKKKTKENKVFYENIIYESIVLFGTRPVIT